VLFLEEVMDPQIKSLAHGGSRQRRDGPPGEKDSPRVETRRNGVPCGIVTRPGEI